MELMACSKDEVAKHFAIDGNSELDDLAALLHSVIVRVGPDDARTIWLPDCFCQGKGGGSFCQRKTPASDMAWALIETFPNTFDDCYTVNNQTVCLSKKVELVVGRNVSSLPW